MGLSDWFARRYITGKLEAQMQRVTAVITWLNAVPGRKRGVAAVLLGVAEAFRVLGHTSVAEYLGVANDFIQNYLVPGADAAGMVAAVWGLTHAAVRKT